MGDGFVPTTGRILSHLGDIVSMGMTPLPPGAVVRGGSAGGSGSADHGQYLFHLESSDIAVLRAEVESLGFQSAVSPGGMVRLVHAVLRAALLSFKGADAGALGALEAKWRRWYGIVTQEGLDLSLCWQTEGRIVDDDFMVLFGGTMDASTPRETSPLIATNDIGLVALGKAMRGDAPDD